MEKDHFEYLSVGGKKMLLKCIFRKYYGAAEWIDVVRDSDKLGGGGSCVSTVGSVHVS
jgi:hypothetical protein